MDHLAPPRTSLQAGAVKKPKLPKDSHNAVLQNKQKKKGFSDKAGSAMKGLTKGTVGLVVKAGVGVMEAVNDGRADLKANKDYHAQQQQERDRAMGRL